MAISDYMDHQEWVDIYKKLTAWELRINDLENTSMIEVLDTQKSEANMAFAKFIMSNYEDLAERS